MSTCRVSALALSCALAWCARAGAQELDAVDRVEGVSRIWMEAHYNFAFFDQVPELDWDDAYRRTLERVADLEDDRAYYRELQRFIARLRDGHSDVSMPAAMRADEGVSPLRVAPIDGEPVVIGVASDLARSIPIGSVITSINGVDVGAYADESVRPFISASSAQHLLNASLGDELIAGVAGRRFSIGLATPDDGARTVGIELLTRDASPRFGPGGEETGPYAFEVLEDGVVYLRIDTFADGEGLREALGPRLPEFLAAPGIVIDLRRNGGGNTSVGAFVAGLLTDRALPGSAWRTREHRAVDLAWGIFADEGTERRRYARERGGWHESEAATWPANPDYRTDAPVVVLTDWRTASAAEDFLIIVDGLEQVTTVGRATYGSSGQPLYFSLPGGGSARVCTKRDTYPDGRDFVGVGIAPDIEVPITLGELTGQQDATLERGLRTLRDALSE